MGFSFGVNSGGFGVGFGVEFGVNAVGFGVGFRVKLGGLGSVVG